MGRLINIDVLFDYFGNDAIDEITRSNIEYFASEKGTVEAIPKADYEARLKADMIAMLTEISVMADELAPNDDNDFYSAGLCDYDNLVQQKIDALKENKHEGNN